MKIPFLNNKIKKGKGEKNDFSAFFIEKKSQQKAKVIRQVLKEANEQQRELIETYKRRAKTA
jgi:hypothetical protein